MLHKTHLVKTKPYNTMAIPLFLPQTQSMLRGTELHQLPLLASPTLKARSLLQLPTCPSLCLGSSLESPLTGYAVFPFNHLLICIILHVLSSRSVLKSKTMGNLCLVDSYLWVFMRFYRLNSLFKYFLLKSPKNHW